MHYTPRSLALRLTRYIKLLVIPILLLTTENLSAQLDNTWWNQALIFGEAPIPSGFSGENVHAWGRKAETAEEIEALHIAVAAAHADNVRYVGTISTFNPSQEALFAHPELLDVRVIDIDQQPSTIEWKSNNDVTVWFYNTNEPLYQDYLKEQVENLIDAGVDAILIDEIEGIAGTLNRGGSFGDIDMQLFSAYLLTLYTPLQMQQYWGIDSATFNYGDYIRNRGSAQAYRVDPFSIPLFEDYRNFERIQVRDFMKELIAYGKAYSLQSRGEEIAFTANIYGWHSHQMLFADLLDYFTVEYGYREDGYAPQNHALPYLLYGNSRGKRSVLLPGVYTGNEIYNWDTTDIGALWMMEAYVSGNAFLHTPKLFGGTSTVDGSFTEFSLDYENNTRLLQYIEKNSFLFEGEQLKRVGLLYSYASDYINYTRDTWGGVAFALQDAHVQFDVLSLGDDVFMEDFFPEQDLSNYDLLVLPWSKNMSQEQIDKLLDFVNDGGKLVIIDEETGSRNQKNQSINRPVWDSVTTTGSHTYGNGTINVLDEGWGQLYFDTRTEGMLVDFLAPFDSLRIRSTDTDGPPTLHLHVRHKKDEPLVSIHALNYDFSTVTQKITATEPFEVIIQLPDNLSGSTDLAAYQMSPDGETIRLSTLMSDDGTNLGMNLEPIGVYSTIVVTTNTHAQALTDPALDALDDYLSGQGSHYSTSLDVIQTLSRINDAYQGGDYLVARTEALELHNRLAKNSRPRVLFIEGNGAIGFIDEYRSAQKDPENPDNASLQDVTKLLSDEFFFESTESYITLDLLSNYDVIALNSPWDWFSDTEVEAMHNFIDAGGGLLVLGNPFGSGALTPITTRYGIIVNGEVLSQTEGQKFGTIQVETSSTHPAFPSNIPLMLNWPTRLTVTSPAITLISTDSNTWMDVNPQNRMQDSSEVLESYAIAAAYEDGDSRVYVLGNSPIYDSILPAARNDLVLRKALRWLVGNYQINANWETPPEISLEYNGANILDGDSSPSTGKGTDFGSQGYSSGSVTRTFRVSNTGELSLSLGAASSSRGEFSVSGLASTISGGSYDDFTVTFDPSSVGTKIATISFSTNDSDENPFNFTVIGVGTQVTAPEISLSDSSQSFGSSSGSHNFSVSSNISWNWSDNASWVTSSESTTQSGNQTFSYSVSPNSSTSSRSATITFTADGLTRTHTITQDGQSGNGGGEGGSRLSQQSLASFSLAADRAVEPTGGKRGSIFQGILDLFRNLFSRLFGFGSTSATEAPIVKAAPVESLEEPAINSGSATTTETETIQFKTASADREQLPITIEGYVVVSNPESAASEKILLITYVGPKGYEQPFLVECSSDGIYWEMAEELSSETVLVTDQSGLEEGEERLEYRATYDATSDQCNFFRIDTTPESILP